jgi:PAS domain S-box-containing protein
MANVTQRSVMLALLMLTCLGALALILVDVMVPGPDATDARFAGLAAVVMFALFIAAWRDWPYAPKSTVIFITLLVALALPEPFVTTVASLSLFLPPVLALVLLNPTWVVGSSAVEIGLLLARSHGQGVYAQGSTLVIFGMLIGGLILSRLLLDNARRATEQAAADLTRQRDMLRFQAHLLDIVEQAVFATDIDGTITYWNRFAERLYGWELAEVRGRNVVELLAVAGNAEGGQIPLADLQKGESINGEFLRRRRDGTIFPVWTTATPFRDAQGGITGIVGVSKDITDRKAAEVALRDNEERFRILFERSPDAIILIDPHHPQISWPIVDCNAVACRMNGYTRDELIGHSIDILNIQPADSEERTAYLERLRREGTIQFETLHRRKDGNCFPIEILTSLISVAGRELVLGIDRDITERKRMEQDLIEERALLARRVDERTADLSAANADLARGARLKDEFLASMSHELRTPLNAILGLSEALQEQVYGPLNDKQCATLHTVEESGRHLLALINDILDLSKIEAGKAQLDIAPVSIASVCQASLQFIKELAHKKRIAVSPTLDPAVTMVPADERRLKQILVNLLSNAVKFTPEGGAIGLEVVGDRAGQVVHLTVWDTGIGIAQDDLPRLFQPFIQLDSRLARRYTGSGLGLALVARMVDLHGGGIAVESTVGQGSRFTISLPWPEPIETSLPGAVSTPIVPNSSPIPFIRQALIIDDSPTAYDQIARYLTELGVVPYMHPWGSDAIARTVELRPDMIVLDIQLPDQSGWDVLAQLKQDPRTRAIPVLIISVEDDRPRGIALGAHEYLVKPITRTQLHMALHKLVPSGIAAVVRAPFSVAPAAGAAAQPVVLLTEDNETNIATLVDYLQAKGYRVVVARNGREVITRAREIDPDVILMDIQMPEIDGLEAIRQIRADTDLAHVPVIALTALAMPGDRERCLEAGADDYLSKPVSLKGLVAAIETLLRRAAGRRNPL